MAEAYGLNHIMTLRLLNGHDYLMPSIAQYDERWQPSIAETSWMAKIKGMIADGNIYYRLIPSKSWAYSDKEREKNFDIVRSLGFEVSNPCESEDARFSFPHKIAMKRLYLTSEETPEELPSVGFKLSGVIEFGTTSIPKTAMCLLQGTTLMRVCYQPKHNLGPWVAILHNTKPIGTIELELD